jgi:hypothetical protein
MKKLKRNYHTLLGMVFETLISVDKKELGLTRDKEVEILNDIWENRKSIIATLNGSQAERVMFMYTLYENKVVFEAFNLSELSFSWNDLSPKFVDSSESGYAVVLVSDTLKSVGSRLFLEKDLNSAYVAGCALMSK